MDDTNAIEPVPTSSKKTCQKTASGHDVHNEEHDTNSISLSTSRISLLESKLNMAMRTDKQIPPMTKGQIQKESKRKGGRKKSRRDRRLRGRVQKAKRSQMRRPQKRRPRTNRRRAVSVSTSSSRLSAGSPRRGRSPTCKYCGRRSCYRRTKRVRFKRSRKNEKQEKERNRMPSESVQVGPRCVMLSPLLVKTNLTIAPEATKEENNYAAITPEMICESLRKLTMWREGVETNAIMNHIKHNYPVDPDSKRVLDELREKLHVAVLTGIVTQKLKETWSLSSALENRQLTSTHVTLFWKLYADTMRPVTRKTSVVIKPESKHAQTSLAPPFDHIYS